MKIKSKGMIVFGILTFVIILSLLVFSRLLASDTETNYELNDLQNMRGAEATARMLWRDRQPEEPVEYWYSAKTFELIPRSEKKPEPYGLGTRKNGKAKKKFLEETGQDYDYDERADYTDKVIHLVVKPSASGGIQVRMNWE